MASGGGRSPVAVARRRIEAADIAFGNANKHRMGWQTMANICGVNVSDLRQACERGYALGEPVIAAAPAAARKNLPTLDPLKVLRAIGEGATCSSEIAELAGCSPKHATRVVAELKAKGWLAGHGRAFSGWIVTEAGRSATRAGGAPLHQKRVDTILRLLKAIHDGAQDPLTLAALAGLTEGSVAVYTSRLREQGWVTGFFMRGLNVTPEGLHALKSRGLADG